MDCFEKTIFENNWGKFYACFIWVEINNRIWLNGKSPMVLKFVNILYSDSSKYIHVWNIKHGIFSKNIKAVRTHSKWQQFFFYCLVVNYVMLVNISRRHIVWYIKRTRSMMRLKYLWVNNEWILFRSSGSETTSAAFSVIEGFAFFDLWIEDAFTDELGNPVSLLHFEVLVTEVEQHNTHVAYSTLTLA